MTAREARQQAGMTQMALAIALKVSLGTVQNVEMGKQIPRVDLAIRYAHALGVGVEEIDWGTREEMGV